MKKPFSFVILSLILCGSVLAVGQINIATVPYTITQPGSYIVVKDLHCLANQTAISITTSDVSIDLNGHTIYGAGTTSGSDGVGIYCNSLTCITLTNGIIRNFRGNAIHLVDAGMSEISKIRVFANGGGGINGGYSAKVFNCVVTNNGSWGIVVNWGSDVSNNNVLYNKGDGILTDDYSVVKGNSSNFNTLSGISTGSRSIITGNNVNYNNGEYGIFGSSFSQIRENNLHNNIGIGIVSQGAGYIIGNNLYYNQKGGISGGGGSIVKDNNVNFSFGNGIAIQGGCLVSGNLVNNGIGIGIYTSSGQNIIQDNALFSNNTAMMITSNGSFYAGNRYRGGSVGISTTAGNTAGNGTTGFVNLSIP